MSEENKPNEISFTRLYDVSVKAVWDAWAEPRQIAQWLPPAGATMQFIRSDIQAGGSAFYCMSMGGMKMYGKTTYKEITKPSRIVYTQVFCDEHEHITRHPMSPTWPEVMLTTVSLSEEGPDATRVTVTWEPFGQVTAAERETFDSSRAGMTQGWNGSFDKLEAYLKKSR